jgi:broad specificity phosphatase PhoE
MQGYEGKPSTPDTKAAFLLMMRDWVAGRLDSKFEGGESPNEVRLRQIEALRIIMSHTEEEQVLICMHGRAMRLLLCLLTGKPLTEMDSFPHQNLVLYKVIFDGEKYAIESFNNADHLKHD